MKEAGRPRWIAPSLVLWHVSAVVLVLLVPTLARNGLPFWDLETRLLLQVPALAIGYLATALVLSIAVLAEAPGRPDGLTLRHGVTAIVTGVAAFGASVLFILELPAFDYSRLVILAGAALGWGLAVLPYLFGRRVVTPGSLPLALLAAGSVAWAVAGPTPPSNVSMDTRDRSTRLISTNLHTLRITTHERLVDRSPATGGGITPHGDGFIVTNGVGDFRRITPTEGTFTSVSLGLPTPANRDAFVADMSADVEGQHFRVMDVLVDTVADPDRLFASHYWWEPDERCVAMRVSAAPLPPEADIPADEGGTGGWETIFTSRPCVPIDRAVPSHLTNHSGGRMAWAPDGRLLVTIADFHQDGPESGGTYPQETGNDYGKILAIDRQGTVEPLTIGHRNPQGLVVTRDGGIWSTEHGPTGGDELNRIRSGLNYGWPVASLGTDDPGMPSPYRPNGGPGFEEPVHAWVPSVGISSLVEVQGSEFPAWEGDLLIASLDGRSLFRTRTLEDRVVFSERIPLGSRLRDLVVDPAGRIVVWTDAWEVIVLENAGDAVTGELVFSQCATCHEATPGAPATAPDLRGIVGRVAGSLDGYAYSPALDAADFTWSPETLDAFLTDPGDVVPGNTMPFEGLDEERRRAVIEYLQDYE